jgi:hypothetical protein
MLNLRLVCASSVSERWTGDGGINRSLWILKGLGATFTERCPMPTIVVSVKPTIAPQPKFNFPPNPKPGLQIFFTEDVLLKQYDAATAGHGLPQNEANRYAGIHSGFLTLLRITGAGDRFYGPDIFIYEYLAMYKFNDLPNTPLKKGQIAGHGLSVFDTNTHTVLEIPNPYAITGGTDGYAKARGQIRELHNATDDRELHIEL